MSDVCRARTYAAVAAVALIASLASVGAATAPAVAPGNAAATPGQRNAADKAAVEKIVHDYLVAHPEILIEMSNALDARNAANEEKKQREALAKLGKGVLISADVAYVVGPADAKVTVVEFFDYRCVHCKNSLPAVQKLIAEGKVRFAFIEHPILTSDSLVAARAAVAARRQKDKYVPFHFALMRTTGDLPQERILKIAVEAGLDADKLKRDMQDDVTQQTVEASQALAQRLHIEGTPTFIIGNKIIGGELTYEEMQQLIKEAKS